MKVYLVVYRYHWSYEDHGTETIACFKELWLAESAAYWLNERRDPRYSVDENFDVEEYVVL